MPQHNKPLGSPYPDDAIAPDHGPNGAAEVDHALAAQCRQLREAVLDYEACALEWVKAQSLPDCPSQTSSSRYDDASRALTASIGATIRCQVRTSADLALKAGTLSSCIQFCSDSDLLADVTAVLLHDIQQVFGSPTRNGSAWRLPAIPLPGFWIGRSRTATRS